MRIDCAQFEKHRMTGGPSSLHCIPTTLGILHPGAHVGITPFCSHYTHLESSICVRDFLFTISVLHPYEHFLPEPSRKLFISGSHVLQEAEVYLSNDL